MAEMNSKQNPQERRASWLEQVLENPKLDLARLNFDPSRPIEMGGGSGGASSGPRRWMDYADLLSFGGMRRTQRTAGDRAFDAEAEDAEGMNASPYESDANKADPFAYRYVKTKDFLGNSDRPSKVTPHEAGHLLWQKYRDVLERRDENSVRLLREMAKMGNDLLEDAARLRLGMDKKDGRGVTISPADDFSVVATTRNEAKVIYNMTRFVLDHYGTATAIHNQTSVMGLKSLPPKESVEQWLKATRPPAFDRDRARGENALAVVTSNEPAAVQVGLSTIAAFQKKMNGRLTLVVREGSMLDEAVRQHMPRLAVERIKPYGRNPEQAARYADEKAVREADAVVAVWTGKESDQVLAATAEAQRRGKLLMAYDGEGKKYDVREIGPYAVQMFPNKKEQALIENLHALEFHASSPAGRYGLAVSGVVSDQSIDRLAASDLTLREVVELSAQDNPRGRERLLKEFGLDSRAFEYFGNAQRDVRANNLKYVADNVAMVVDDCQRHNVTMVGRDAFPNALKDLAGKGASVPQVLFVQGDSKVFSGFDKSVALVGDAKLNPVMAELAAEAAKVHQDKGNRLVLTEGAGAPALAPNGPSLLVIATGHGHLANEPCRLGWAVDKAAGEIRAESREGTYLIRKAGSRLELALREPDGTERALKAVEQSATAEEKAKKQAVAALKDTAWRDYAERVVEPQRALREAALREGVIVSALPPTASGYAYSHTAKGLVGSPTTRSPERVREAITLAATLADKVLLTQVSKVGEARHAVPEVVGRRSVERLVVPSALRALPEVSGNRALMRPQNGREMAAGLDLGETARIAMEKTLPNETLIRGVATPGYHAKEHELKSALRVAKEATKAHMAQRKDPLEKAPRARIRAASGDNLARVDGDER